MTPEKTAIILDDYDAWRRGEIEDLPYAKPVVRKAMKKALDDVLDMEVEKLPDDFYGKGEVRGFRFIKVRTAEDYYIFKVHPVPNEKAHYELIERNLTPICLDFENKVYSKTKFKERFPKAKDFGVWAWTYPTIEKALKAAKQI